MSKIENVGRMTGNTQVEDLSAYKWDTITINLGSKIKETQLFPAPQKNKLLQNDVLPLGKGKAFAIKYVRVTHNITFNDPQQIWAFEQFSYLSFNIEDVNYSPIPLSHLLPYNRVKTAFSSLNDATTPITTVTTDQATAKDGGYVKLPSPIIIPEQGRIELAFVPGADITTKSTAGLGVKFGTGIVTPNADTEVYFIKIEFLGTEVRERTR